MIKDDIAGKFVGLDAKGALRLASELFPGKIAFATSLGAEDQVILHFIVNENLPIKVFTLDTGRMFPETYDLLEKNRIRYKIQIEVYFPNASDVEAMVNEKGINLFYESIENRKLCCNIRKIKPLRRALAGCELWITGLRRAQAITRNSSTLIEWDENNGLWKLNPLIEWSNEQLWEYIHNEAIPYNILHDRGFPSIGCQPCTRAVMPGEDIRAGRWWWENPETRECGLHKR